MLFGSPAAVSLGFFFVPPIFIDMALGLLLAYLAARYLNRTGLSRYFWHTPLAFLGLFVLMSSLVGIFVLTP
ncbi:MAG: DUF1656 domain-containing protein [Pseudomonadota bacterium]